MENNLQETDHYKNALLKYAHAYVLGKRKSKGEKELEDSEVSYVIYARKSTEDDQRQIQSIEDQVESCLKYAKVNKLQVVDIIREEKSAKVAGKREKYNDMIKRIYDGEFNGILSWHPDRDSRNMKESGELLDMLDNGILADMKFVSFTFNNDAAGKMTLSILFAMAKEFSDKLSEDTKRGNRRKVGEGKYMGSAKKGYINGNGDYFRPHPDTYQIFKQAWKMYQNNSNQSKVGEWLIEQGEEISTNMLSIFFRDPFSAGIYCYGDQIVDLATVDTKFQPMVTPKEFILMQKLHRDNPRGWHISSEFRPFNEFMVCGDCGNFMTTGVSKGKIYRYLSATCGNRKCKSYRKKLNLKPIANTIRGETIKEFAKDAIRQLKNVPEEMYKKAKDAYFSERNVIVKNLNDQISLLKSKLTKLENKAKKEDEKIYSVSDPELIKRFTDNLKSILHDKNEVANEMRLLEKKKSEYEYQMESDFPPYDDFLNFFENALLVLDESDNIYLIDQIARLVFLNLTAKDKKISGYCLQEAFIGFENLKILTGVADGT